MTYHFKNLGFKNQGIITAKTGYGSRQGFLCGLLELVVAVLMRFKYRPK
jgi:hypothetical protein